MPPTSSLTIMMSTPETISSFRVEAAASWGRTRQGRRLAYAFRLDRKFSSPFSGFDPAGLLSHLYLRADMDWPPVHISRGVRPTKPVKGIQSDKQLVPANGCEKDSIALLACVLRHGRIRRVVHVDGCTANQVLIHRKGIVSLFTSSMQQRCRNFHDLGTDSVARQHTDFVLGGSGDVPVWLTRISYIAANFTR